MKRKHIRTICIAAIAAILVAACCMALLNSEWMHKKYGYGQDAIETEEMWISICDAISMAGLRSRTNGIAGENGWMTVG